MMSVRLCGLLVPFGVRTRIPLKDGLHEVIDDVAIDALDPATQELVEFRINHDPRLATRWPDATIGLRRSPIGLHVTVALPDGPLALAVAQTRLQWKGWSVSFDKSDLWASRVDARTKTRHVTLGFVTGASLITSGRPAYPGTWVAFRTTESWDRVHRETWLGGPGLTLR